MTVALNIATYAGTGPDRRTGPGRVANEAAGTAGFAATLIASPDRGATVSVPKPGLAGSDSAGSEQSRRPTAQDAALDSDGDRGLGKAERDRFADHRVAALSLSTGGSLLQTLVDTLVASAADASRKSDAARQGYARTRALMPPAAL